MNYTTRISIDYLEFIHEYANHMYTNHTDTNRTYINPTYANPTYIIRTYTNRMYAIRMSLSVRTLTNNVESASDEKLVGGVASCGHTFHR